MSKKSMTQEEVLMDLILTNATEIVSKSIRGSVTITGFGYKTSPDKEKEITISWKEVE